MIDQTPPRALASLLLALLGTSGCVSLLPPESASTLPSPSPPPAPAPECRHLDGRFRTSVGLARLGGAGAVTSGLSSALSEGTTRTVFGASALTFGLLAAVSGYIQARSASKYVQTCTVNTGELQTTPGSQP